jgi:hypothetical protein
MTRYLADHNVPLVVCDIDMTIADNRHRAPEDLSEYDNWTDADWAFFYSHDRVMRDVPFAYVVPVLKQLFYRTNFFFLTGRDEIARISTLEWLSLYGMPVSSSALFMREEGDRRPSHVYKADRIKTIIDIMSPHPIIFSKILIDDDEGIRSAFLDLGWETRTPSEEFWLANFEQLVLGEDRVSEYSII